MAYTFLQLRGRVNDVPHLPKNQSTGEVDSLINESYAYIVAELQLLQKTITKPLVAADGDYSFIGDFNITDYAAVRALFYTAANSLVTFDPLRLVTTAELFALRANNPTATSPAKCYSINGWNSLSLQPLPAAGDTLAIWYSAYPVPLSLPGDTPVAIPTHLHHLIVGHAAAVAMETVDVAYAQRMHADFETNEMNRARRWLNNHRSSLPYAPNVTSLPNDWPSTVWGRSA